MQEKQDIHVNGRLFNGVRLKEEYDRGQRMTAQRIATLFNPVTGNIREFSEGDLLEHLFEIDDFVESLPEAKNITHLLNRSKAGFRLPNTLRESVLDAESAIWLLDHMYGGKTIYPEKLNWEL